MAARLTLTDRREGKVSEVAMFESYMVSLFGGYHLLEAEAKVCSFLFFILVEIELL